jgi:hypothetical protein
MARGASGDRGQRAVDQALHFEDIGFIARGAVVEPVVRARPALDHDGDRRWDRTPSDQPVKRALQADLQEGVVGLFVAVQQVDDGVAHGGARVAGRQVDQEGACAVQCRRGVAAGVD